MTNTSPITLVLMGRTGNGKSATGNSILGKNKFRSRKSASGLTKSSELQSCVRKDGQVINVIDTPGLFDLSSGIDYISKEIVKSIDLASNGIHAVLLVFSVRNRFSQEEEATVRTLQNLFGFKILDYVITVFTGGDEFEDEDGDTFEDYLRDCPVPLKDILTTCKNRCVLFDNKTRSGTKNSEQVNNLLTLVDEVIAQNGGPFTHTLFINAKFEEKLNEIKTKLEIQIEQEREERRKAEEKYQEMNKQLGEQIREQNQKIIDMLSNRPPEVKVVRDRDSCSIL